MEERKKIVAENITKLRTSLGMTQAQLGEKLNYSDKSVSKWERGESIPDVFVLKTIADLAGVTVDWLLNPHDEAEETPKPVDEPRRYSRRFITLTVLAGIWALAVLVFVVLWLAGIFSWLVFVCAIPVSLITLLVLNSIWGDRALNLYIISGLAWSIITLIYLSALDQNWWQLFLLAIPAQIIIIFAFSIKPNPKKQDKN
ncbi:helix-turn-helix domain-containing protein [uncultured Ruminococcus sp.]|uniref:helix-turn-helix domain-containing protein n=1 Tax=uncultured Ruminococcus sp. TaxID=165186 RepID=UPI00292E823E|nr:helix-turn-helix domain-containing protein [uncultured Ruminococcus sp.]